MTNLLSGLSDRVNPIVVKETRQAVSSRLVSSGLLLFLITQVVTMFLMMTARNVGDSEHADMRLGREFFTIVQGILLGTCMLLIPAMTGMRLAGERSDVKVDLFFISSLSPRAVVAGKLMAAMAVALLIFSACTPFMAFAYILRGLDMPTIMLVLLADLLSVLVATMVTLFCAAIPTNRGFRLLLGLFAFIFLCYLFAGTLALTNEFLEFGVGNMDSWEFWAAIAGCAALILGLVGQVFVWTVALISPPTANRALPVRVYAFCLWVASGVACAVWSWNIRYYEPMMLWGIGGVGLGILQMIIGISERDRLGPRVARRIPRWAFLRIPAFLLYSGVVNGLAFGLFIGTFSVLGMWLWVESAWIIPFRSGSSRDLLTAIYAGGLAVAYAYCYCLMAALLRPFIRNSGFSTSVTWFIGLAVFGLCSTIPLIIQFTMFDRQHQDAFHADVFWIHLMNPAIIIPFTLEDRTAHLPLTITFLIVWAGIVTLLNGRWLWRQVSEFRPLKSAISTLKPVAPVPA